MFPNPASWHRISGTLTARFILRLRALTTTPFGGSPTHNASSTATVFSSLRIAHGSARSRSFADEFGDEPGARTTSSSEHPRAVPEGGKEDYEQATPDEESCGVGHLASTN